MNIENNLSEAPKMLKYEFLKEFSSESSLTIQKQIQIEQEIHLSAMCYMPDEEVFVLGGWNSKQIKFYDSRADHFFELIMELDTQHIFNLSNLKYLEPLKLLFVGDCFSGLSIFRYQ
jgi:hypothetical protein